MKGKGPTKRTISKGKGQMKETIIGNNGTTRSHHKSTPKSVHTVERIMRQKIVDDSLELASPVEKRGIRLPTVARERYYHLIIKDRISDNPQCPHNELKAEFLH